MKSACLSIPGKTFFAGEYLALEGGPALLACTKPRFFLNLTLAAGQNPFHPESAAGIFYQTHQHFFSRLNIKFEDPYQGVGGFGASSAQFALLHGLFQLQDEVWSESERFFDWHQLLSDYRQQAAITGYSPSGADVVSQACGGITYFDRNNGKVQTFAWPFSEYGFYLFSTGRKVPTHEHLKEIKNIPVQQMEETMAEIRAGISEVHFDAFISGMTAFKNILVEKNWVAPHTKSLLAQISDFPGSVFAKGCGALGADVILVIYDKTKDSLKLKELIEKLGLKFRADERDLDSGLKVEGIHAKI